MLAQWVALPLLKHWIPKESMIEAKAMKEAEIWGLNIPIRGSSWRFLGEILAHIYLLKLVEIVFVW